MLLKDLWNLLEKQLFLTHSTEDLFNPYRDNDPLLDLPNGNQIRKQNLLNYINSFPKKPPVLVLGEAPGIKGCRFSGVPFTSEEQLCNKKLPFEGLQSSNKTVPYSENTATIFWKVMLPYYHKIFVWNCVPFHPHKKRQNKTNRKPTQKEITTFLPLLKEIISLLQPQFILAIGRNAEFALQAIEISPLYIRHPSHGGAKIFEEKIKNFFNTLSMKKSIIPPSLSSSYLFP